MGWRLEQHAVGCGLFHDDIQANLVNQPVALWRGKLRRYGDEASARPQNAESVRDVIRSIGTFQADTRTRQGTDERAQLPHETGAFIIEGGVGRFLSILENGHRGGIGFFENLFDDVHLKVRLPLCLPPPPWRDMCR